MVATASGLVRLDGGDFLMGSEDPDDFPPTQWVQRSPWWRRVSDGESLWAVRYATEGPARSLFASADVDSIRRLHPDNPRFQRLTGDDRLIVSEPFSDLPGVWREVPERTAVLVRRGGVLEERPFTPS